MLQEAGVLAAEGSPGELIGLLQQPMEDEPRGRGSSLSPFRRVRLLAGLLTPALVAVAVVVALRPPVAASRQTAVHAEATFQVESAVGRGSRYQCLDSYELSDFSSKGNMELAGWSFNWDDEFTFKPPIYQMYAPSTAYWGCSKHGGGTISLTLQGQGILTLDFGNSWGNESSSVTAFLNGAKWDVAGPYTFSKTVKIPFKDGDTLDIVEGPSGVIVINSITFRCASTTTTSTSTPPPTTTTTATTATSTRTSTTVVASTRSVETTTTPAPNSTTTLASTVTRTTVTTTSAWQDIEKAKQEWLHEYGELQTKRLEERKKKEQLEHQLKLEREVLERIRKEREQLRKDTQAEKAALERAKAERAKAEKRREERQEAEGGNAKNRSNAEAPNATGGVASAGSSASAETGAVGGSMPNRTGERAGGSHHEVHDAGNASNATHRAGKVLEGASRNMTRETRLAEAVATQKKHTQEELQRLKQARQKQQEEEEQMAQHMEHELEKVDEGGGHTKTQRPHRADLRAPSLYCYSLMLPFGYEPGLLKAQKDRGVGIFACNEFAVFSNSTVLLDKEVPAPVDVTLLNFSLAVPYGGKWHTALNTGVFNGVWTEIVSLGNYRMHDWVVKADPDSVLFPKRLVQLLQYRKPMDQVMNTVSTRRLYVEARTGRRLQWSAPTNATCGNCRMPGFTGQSCNSHVQFIQKQGHSCSEAIRRVARPPPTDCGCDCNRVESCDFKMDPKMYQDFQVIEGKAYPGAMYINNCKFGLHGPIEVLSQRAVTAYVEGLPRCNNLLIHPWGEDKFMDRCMLELGVTRVNQFGLLSEIACGETPAPCGDANVAFHPFKSIDSYFACWEYADRYGHGPADPDYWNASHASHGVVV